MNSKRMPVVNNSTNSTQMKASSSASCIRTISSYVSNASSSSSPTQLSSSSSASSIRNHSLKSAATKCPHVILIGNVYIEDLDPDYRREIQLKKQVI